MTSAGLASRWACASTRLALHAFAAAFVGCGGSSGDGGGSSGSAGSLAAGGQPASGGNTAVVGGATHSTTAGAGGRTASMGGSDATGGDVPVGGSLPTGGVTGGGGPMSGTGGRVIAQGGTTTAAGGTTTGTGGSIEASGGSTTAGTGGTTTGTGGTTAGSGGSTTGTGGTTAGSGGTTAGTGGSTTVDIDPNALFVARDGRAGASGKIDDPMTLADAVSRVNAGQTIYVRGGKYALGSTISLSKTGSNGSPIDLRAYPLDSDRPLFDFSAMSESSSNRGVTLSGSYWHVYGIDLYAAGDNCMFVGGSNNTIEFSTFSECADTGLQLGSGAANNLILNCDSYFNADSTLENADGFAAKLDVGTGNKFVGCRAWNNLDDGWDGYLRPADNVTTTYENCWAIDNGKLKNGSVGAGDGNGFKTGGSDDKALRHNATYKQCIAAGNVHDGFDHNSNRGSVTILNCAAHNNGSNINFTTSNIAASLTIKNTISLGTNGELSATRTDITNNSWQNGLSAASNDFVSVDTALLKSPRQKDGSLPNIDYLRLVSSSDLRNAGVDVGLPYSGSAPDIGPFESGE